MSQVFIIMQKEFREVISNRSSVVLGAAVSIFFALSYGFSMATGSQASLDATIFFIAAVLGVFMSYTFDAQVFLREKTDRVVETLLCAPVSLRQVLLGKTLGVSLISSLIMLLAMTVLVVVSGLRNNDMILPSVPIIVYVLLMVPMFVAAFAGLYGLAQLAMGLRENRFIGLFIFIPLFIALATVPSLLNSGLAISWPAVAAVAGGSLVLLALAGFLSRYVNKERIVTTLS